MENSLDVRFLSMKTGALFFGANVKIHIFSEYKDNQPFTYCGLTMNLAKPLLQREIIDLQTSLTSGISPLSAGVCAKCRHLEMMRLEFPEEHKKPNFISRRRK